MNLFRELSPVTLFLKLFKASICLVPLFSLMDQYYQSLSVSALIMISIKCPVIVEEDMVIVMT